MPVAIQRGFEEPPALLTGITELGMDILAVSTELDTFDGRVEVVVVAGLVTHLKSFLDILMAEQCLEALQPDGHANIMGWGVTVAADIETVGAVDVAPILWSPCGKITLAVVEMAGTAVSVVEGGPDCDVGIHELGAKEQVGLMGVIRAVAVFELDAVDGMAALGDDVDDSRDGHVAIERGGRAAEHLDMVDLLGADGIGARSRIVETAVQTVAVLHDEDHLLTDGVGTVHREVVIYVIGQDFGHAGDIGRQNLIQVLVVTQFLNHLRGDDGDRRRCLVDTLALTGGRGDGRSHTNLEFPDDILETGRVAGGVIVVVQFDQPFRIMPGLVFPVFAQAAKGKQPVSTLQESPLESIQIGFQDILCLVNATDIISFLSLF